MIKTREDLIHVLTEAAEIEHNLLCSYLYATFSLKRANEGGLVPQQGAAVERWRKLVLSVAIEEMGHLACVNNLLLAIGGAAHFDRANLPVSPGYHPSGIVVRLTPFTLDTLQHFIFLERPETDPEVDGAGFKPEAPEREEMSDRLTPSAIDYRTIGDLYDAVAEGVTRLVALLGETTLFAHGTRGQLDAKQTGLKNVGRVVDLRSALALVEQIKEQGEGSSGAHEDCHYDRFQAIKSEWAGLLQADPHFKPAWPAAHDPVMRRPLVAEERVWVTEKPASDYLDCGNAAYGLMLTVLQQVYGLQEIRFQDALMKFAIGLMGLAAIFGNALARMPARSSQPDANAGLTFTVPRNLGFRVGNITPQLRERLGELESAMLRAAVASDREKIEGAIQHCYALIPAIT